jgi:multidrug transporter EmrE-like cation transporter
MNRWYILVLALILNAGANILLKLGAKTPAVSAASSGYLARVLAFCNGPTVWGIVLFAANVLVYRKALEQLDISVAYPVMVSGGLILVTLAALALPALSEEVTAVQVLGILLIATGVWCVVGTGGAAGSQ